MMDSKVFVQSTRVPFLILTPACVFLGASTVVVSQLGAWASGQSKMMNSCTILESMVDNMKHKYAKKEVPLPPFWGGYRVKPKTFDFCQEQNNRLHDRFIYQKNKPGEWYNERLAL